MCCVCVFISVWDGVCSRRTLCGHGECEKLGVLTALEQFQYSAEAGGARGLLDNRASCRGENGVSGGVDRRGRV